MQTGLMLTMVPSASAAPAEVAAPSVRAAAMAVVAMVAVAMVALVTVAMAFGSGNGGGDGCDHGGRALV